MILTILTLLAAYLLAAAGAAMAIAVHNQERDGKDDRAAIHAAYGLAWPFLVIALAVLVAMRFVPVRWRE